MPKRCLKLSLSSSLIRYQNIFSKYLFKFILLHTWCNFFLSANTWGGVYFFRTLKIRTLRRRRDGDLKFYLTSLICITSFQLLLAGRISVQFKGPLCSIWNLCCVWFTGDTERCISWYMFAFCNYLWCLWFFWNKEIT